MAHRQSGAIIYKKMRHKSYSGLDIRIKLLMTVTKALAKNNAAYRPVTRRHVDRMFAQR